jgi:hypothetical protein
MTAASRRLSRIPIYAAIVLALAVWVWVAVTVEPLPRLLIAVLIAALPLAAPEHAFRVVAGVALALMCAGIVLTSLGVGMFLAPSALALAVAAFQPRRSAATGGHLG